MVKKKKGLLMALIPVLSLAFTSCPTGDDDDNGYDTGTATGSSKGYVSDVIVTITMEGGTITDAVISGNESPGYGAPLILQAPAIIKQKNSVDLVNGVDVSTAATTTLKAIKAAGNEAINKIKKGEFD
jgi:major membrane immunogen (membrane-anchored lipoprotein)